MSIFIIFWGKIICYNKLSIVFIYLSNQKNVYM